MMRLIAISLPGMAREENTTMSPGSSVDRLVLVLDDAGERRPRFALAAGQERHDLVARKMLVGVLVEERRQAVEIAELGRRHR